jgi:integrase
MAKVKSKKFEGVYHYNLKNGDTSYYITYKDNENTTVTKKIGRKSEGVNESYCSQVRYETISKLNNSELPPKIAIQKKQNIVTLDSLAEFYFDTKDNKSLHKYKGKYTKRIQPILGKKDVRYMSEKDFKIFQQALLDDGLSNHTTNCYVDIVSAIISHSIQKRNFIGKNPTTVVKKLKVDNKRERILNRSEIDDLLEAVEESWILNLFVRLSLSLGARKSTVLNIKKCDVDLENKMITLKDFKNNSTYTGYFSDDIIFQLVKNRMAMIADDEFLISSLDYKDMDGYISRKLNTIFYYLFNHKLKDQNDRKNKVVTHTLRHTVLSHLAMNGESIFTIKSISNHKSLQMLERYVKLNPAVGKKPIENLWKEKSDI